MRTALTYNATLCACSLPRAQKGRQPYTRTNISDGVAWRRILISDGVAWRRILISDGVAWPRVPSRLLPPLLYYVGVEWLAVASVVGNLLLFRRSRCARVGVGLYYPPYISVGWCRAPHTPAGGNDFIVFRRPWRRATHQDRLRCTLMRPPWRYGGDQNVASGV
jgi:hypothetical protein